MLKIFYLQGFMIPHPVHRNIHRLNWRRTLLLQTVMIKKETGKTALEYIQGKVMELANEKIFDPSKTVNEIAYELGFKYPSCWAGLYCESKWLTIS